MYLGGVIIFSTNLIVTAVVLIAAVLFWREGYFENVEEAKYRMMRDNDRFAGRRSNVE
jgi:hypothetical protein